MRGAGSQRLVACELHVVCRRTVGAADLAARPNRQGTLDERAVSQVDDGKVLDVRLREERNRLQQDGPAAWGNRRLDRRGSLIGRHRRRSHVAGGLLGQKKTA